MELKFDNKIKLVISDFDGVFTDGSVIITEDGEMAKKINFSDVMGVHILLKTGIKFAIISGEKTAAIDYLKEKFNIEDVFQGIRKKVDITQQLLEKYNLSSDEVVYIGDDINDIESMNLIKYAVAPNNANYKVKELPNITVLSVCGGEGFFRKVTDTLIEQNIF